MVKSMIDKRQHYIDCINNAKVVSDMLDACGFDSIEDVAEFMEYADEDDLFELARELEIEENETHK